MTLSVAAGTLIDGRYRVVSRVGSGGMAEVYCADDIQLGRRVAVKLLHERFAADEEFVERFRREASSAASLSHANIVAVYDRGEWAGTYYIAMEYLDGRSLDSIVREEAPLPAERAIEITEQVLRAARFAHRRGVVHRDLKPHNVIIDEEGRVKVTDFGIARAGASEITQTGSIMGTARYLSPEQAQGQRGQPAQRHLRDRRDALRAADGRRPVRGRLGRRDRAAPPLGAAAAAELARPVDLAGARRDRPARARQGPRAALRRRRRVPRRARGRARADPRRLRRPRPRRWRPSSSPPPPPPTRYPATYATQALGADHGRARPQRRRVVGPRQHRRDPAGRRRAAAGRPPARAGVAVGPDRRDRRRRGGGRDRPAARQAAPHAAADAADRPERGRPEGGARGRTYGGRLRARRTSSSPRCTARSGPSSAQQPDGGHASYTKGSTVVLEISSGPRLDDGPDPERRRLVAQRRRSRAARVAASRSRPPSSPRRPCAKDTVISTSPAARQPQPQGLDGRRHLLERARRGRRCRTSSARPLTAGPAPAPGEELQGRARSSRRPRRSRPAPSSRSPPRRARRRRARP